MPLCLRHKHLAKGRDLNTASQLKGFGYLTSSISVLLLGTLSIKTASESPWLAACLILGMGCSVLGMFLRWRSHRVAHHEKEHIKEMARQNGTRYQAP